MDEAELRRGSRSATALLSSLCGVAIAIALATGVTSLSAASPVIRIESGLVQGTQTGEAIVYRSIPYASPPTGELRWKAPQPPPSWTGVRQTGVFGPVCMQTGVSVPGAAPEPASEDCLTLNVWTPADARAKLPVMVWIPGGGFTQESASMPLYWGDALTRRGVIVVTINYRVGVFGFLAHPELSRESRFGTSGNYGLLDQIAALEWVKRNIGAFGGDAGRVTIWGQSAGAMAVTMLTTSPLSKGLMHRAIGQSGGFFTPPEATLQPDTWFLRGAEAVGQTYMSAAGATSIGELRTRPAEALLKTGGGTRHPIIDGYVLPQKQYDVFMSGRQHDVPTLVGFNAEEARSMLGDRSFRVDTFAEDVATAFGSPLFRDLANDYLRLHRPSTDDEARQVRVALERDLRFGWEVWTWARLQARTGRKNAFLYYFTLAPAASPGALWSAGGAGHWAELRYVFDHLEPGARDADRKMASSMAAYWTNFAKSGNPNGGSLPRWRPVSANGDTALVLGERIEMGALPALQDVRLIDGLHARLRSAAR